MIATIKLASVKISLMAKIELFPCAGHVAGDRCSEHLLFGFAGRVSAYGNNIGGKLPAWCRHLVFICPECAYKS